MTQVKICGITSREDALQALSAGADAIGLNFVEGTPRALDEDRAREISALASGRAVRVGVFRDMPRAAVIALAERVELDVIQLHGQESPEYVAGFPFPVIKALPASPDLA